MASFLDYVKGAVKNSKVRTGIKVAGYVNPFTTIPTAIADKQGVVSNQINKSSAPQPARTPFTVQKTSNPLTNPSFVQDAYAYGNDTYSGANGGSGGTATDANQGLLDQYRGDAYSLINRIKGAYDTLFGKVQTIAKDKESQLLNSFNTEKSNLDKSYETGNRQIGTSYGARGLGSSGYIQDAYDEAANTYKTGNAQLEQGLQSGRATIGQTLTEQQAAVEAAKRKYDAMGQQLQGLDATQYGDAGTVRNNLQAALPDVESETASMGTQGDYINKINAISPLSQTATSTLAAQLQKIVTSSAPAMAKKQIAQGLIKAANLQDANSQTYWNNYFEQLLAGA